MVYNSCLTDNQEFRKPNTSNLPYLYATLCIPNDKVILFILKIHQYNFSTFTEITLSTGNGILQSWNSRY